MTTRLADYKGFGVTLDDSGKFEAHELDNTISPPSLGEDLAESKTLEELKKTIDEMSRQKLGQDCWIDAGGWHGAGGWVKGKITSVKVTRGYDNSMKRDVFRVTFKDPENKRSTRRDEVNISRLYRDTPENVITINQIRDLQKAIMENEKLQEKLTKQLKTFTEKELLQ